MKNLTFDGLNQAWNVLRTRAPRTMASHIPTLQNPRALLMTRVDESPYVMTVMFRGFDQAIADNVKGTPAAKRFLLDWVRTQGGEAQIQRGDPDNLLVRITKPSQNPMPTRPVAEAIEPVRTGPLSNILQVRKVHAN